MNRKETEETIPKEIIYTGKKSVLFPCLSPRIASTGLRQRLQISIETRHTRTTMAQHTTSSFAYDEIKILSPESRKSRTLISETIALRHEITIAIADYGSEL